MVYRVRSLSGDETLDSLTVHVLARAYRAAWRARHGNEPSGSHVMAALDLIIEYTDDSSGGHNTSCVLLRRS